MGVSLDQIAGKRFMRFTTTEPEQEPRPESW
jgi:hypothetical protein